VRGRETALVEKFTQQTIKPQAALRMLSERGKGSSEFNFPVCYQDYGFIVGERAIVFFIPIPLFWQGEARSTPGDQ